MPARTTDLQPFSIRGTPSVYREIRDADNRAVVEAQIAERECQTVAREVAASRRRSKGRDCGETAIRPPSSPADEIATDSEQWAPAYL